MKLVEYVSQEKKSFIIVFFILTIGSLFIYSAQHKVFDISQYLMCLPFVYLSAFIFGFVIFLFTDNGEK